MYDYLVVGSGLYGAVYARSMAEKGRSVLILERKPHVGGNLYCHEQYGYHVHEHGPHIFHTSSKRIWNYVNQFADFSHYRHKVCANYKGKIFSLPFNLMTYYQMWGCTTPTEAQQILESQKVKIEHPSNLEELALSQIGPDLYHSFVYGYTKKQWGREPKLLPISILKRIPVRLTYNDNYYNDKYQGIPIEGYTYLIEQLIDGIEVRCNENFDLKTNWRSIARKLVYSGSLDELYGYDEGVLEYRGLRFVHEIHEGDFQGASQVNYTDEGIPYTRIVEHCHFTERPHVGKSVITYEYPVEWSPGCPRYYPINDHRNNAIHEKYMNRIRKEGDIVVGGRLGSFRYFDMDMVAAQALTAADRELKVK
jgi:UDP-galactopyranose mutase